MFDAGVGAWLQDTPRGITLAPTTENATCYSVWAGANGLLSAGRLFLQPDPHGGKVHSVAALHQVLQLSGGGRVQRGAELGQDLDGGYRREGVDHLLYRHRPLDIGRVCRSRSA